MVHPDPPTTILLSLPRCGTHFFWTRYVASGHYQLIYDADRVAALTVLAEHEDRPLSFLHPAPMNPNYNFQYNSLADANGPMTAAEHLHFLQDRYGARDPQDLFVSAMAAQDTGGRGLLSVNRFCYTISYDWMLPDISWTIDHALRAMDRLCDWQRQLDPRTVIVLVVRDVPQWVDSLLLLWGRERRARVARRLKELPPLLDRCRDRGIAVYRMSDAIDTVNSGNLHFQDSVDPMSDADTSAMVASAADCLGRIDTWPIPPNRFRLGRFLSYIFQRDPILRTSLVRSIGTLPHTLDWLPLVGRRVRSDFQGGILNNARIRSDR